MKLSVVVCTWNRAEMVRATLQSLASQDYPSDRFETIVVDDGSKDHTHAVVREFSNVRYVRVAHGGLNRARNAGIENAKGEVIVFVDDDETAPPDHLSKLDRLFASSDADAIGGPFDWIAGARSCPDHHAHGPVALPHAPDGQIELLLGGNMAIRRTAFDERGLFDPALSGIGDESEWFMRSPGRFLYVDSLRMFHHREHMSSLDVVRAQFRQGRSLPLFFAKTGRSWRPNYRQIARLTAHGVKHRCTYGLARAARNVGAVTACWRQNA
jgi:glycosyltransferase involved in cell wall biosynthesis